MPRFPRLPRLQILDPRHYRMDDILRGPYTPVSLLTSSGPGLRATRPQGWGLGEGIFWQDPQARGELGPIHLRILTDGRPVEPGDAIYRPSHLTLHGRDEESGLQVTEDKFITGDDVAVTVLALRNPDEYHVDVEIERRWGVPSGESQVEGQPPVYIARFSPPLDDLLQKLPGQAHRFLVFAVAFAATAEDARERARRWTAEPNPALRQSEDYQSWFDRYIPLFDCADPWLTKLWYHHWSLVRRNRGGAPVECLSQTAQPVEEENLLPRLTDFARRQFAGGNYLQPIASRSAGTEDTWTRELLQGLLGIRPLPENRLEVRPLLPPVERGGWSHFCLQNLTVHGQSVTLVWDDPAAPEDAYGDGLKGLVLLINGEKVYWQANLQPFLWKMDIDY